MIFHDNHLLADDSHEIPFLISFENEERCHKICRLLQSWLALLGLKLYYDISLAFISGSIITTTLKS